MGRKPKTNEDGGAIAPTHDNDDKVLDKTEELGDFENKMIDTSTLVAPTHDNAYIVISVYDESIPEGTEIVWTGSKHQAKHMVERGYWQKK